MSEQRDIRVITTVAEMQNFARSVHGAGQTIGCVPTMGYLHEGHASLIRVAAARHQVVAVSIFVNPTQFGPTEDFARYPRDLSHDLEIVRASGGTVVFAPTVEEMYPYGAKSTIHVSGITEMLEGAMRPTHFDGVATVVSRLFEAMMPDEAFFGRKDLQQTLVIRKMVAVSETDTVRRVLVTVLPTLREADGLARSSRNVYLSAEDRADAPIIYLALSDTKNAILHGEHSTSIIESVMRNRLSSVNRLTIDYAVAVDAETLLPKPHYSVGAEVALCIAVRLGKTRLIDNEVVCITT